MPVDTDIRVRFGPFIFDRHSGRLEKQGCRIKLQPKSATVLACLIENSTAIVTRQHLQSRLWSEGTYVDFDLGIKVAVRRLRDALGDSAEEPIYIQTIRSEGYRFIGQIEPAVVSAEPSLAAREPEKAARSDAEIAAARSTAKLWVRIATAAVLLIAAAATILWPHHPAVAFRNGDWLLVGAFENKTGDKLFDGSIEYGFEREIGESRYVNVVSRTRMDDTLLLMREKKGTQLDENLARQVALRDTGIRAVLSGRIERFDASYVLTARLIEPASGKVVAVFEQSGKKNDIPQAIRRIADLLRPRLGETGRRNKVLQRATTTSLEALQAFSSGMQAINDDKWQEGAALFEGATGLDPQFALAHVFAGYAEEQLGEEEKARPHFKRAFELADGTSERERLFIRGCYFTRFEPDPVRATREFLSLVNLYPDDLWGVRLLLWNSTAGNPVLLHSTGMTPADRVELLDRVVRVRPTSPDSLIDLMYLTRYALNDPVRSEKYRERLAELRANGGAAPANWIELDLLPVLEAWRVGDIATADRELPRLTERALRQTSIRMKFDVAMANLQIGHLSDAQRVCAALPPLALKTTNMNRENCSLVVAYLRGDRTAVAQEVKKILEATPVGDVNDFNGIGINVMLHAGLLHDADTLLARRLPSHTLPQLRGQVLLAQGKPLKALDALRLDYTPLDRLLTTRGSYFWTREAMARALAELGSLDEAIRILHETDPANVRYMSASTWSLPRLLLIQLLRQAGRNAEADSVEAELRHYMAFAEKDHILFKILQSQSQSRTRPAVLHAHGDGTLAASTYGKKPQ